MDYRKITPEDAHFLTKIFSVPEYDLYFAENETTEEDWRERIALFDDVQSLIVSDGSKDVGWLMYRAEGGIVLDRYYRFAAGGTASRIREEDHRRFACPKSGDQNHKAGCTAEEPSCCGLLQKNGLSCGGGGIPAGQRSAGGV